MDTIGYWMGEPISEMSREELLEVIRQLGEWQRMERAARENELAMLKALDRAREANRRRGPFGLWWRRLTDTK